MKKLIIRGWLFILIIMSLLSCNEKKIQYFKLKIVLNEPISNIKENEPLPPYLTTLMNYIDTNCINVLYVPITTFERSDFNPSKTFIYEVPISGVNKFRKSLDMLSSINLREDYDDNIKKLVVPKILVEPKGSVKNVSTTSQNKPYAFELQINENNIESLPKLSEKIKKILCDGKGNNLITINIIDSSLGSMQSKDETSRLITEADNLFAKKQYKEAQKIYTEVFETNPRNDYIKTQLLVVGIKLLPPPPPPPLPSTTLPHSSRNFENGDRYVGEMRNGKMHGLGTFYYNSDQIISEKDLKKRKALKGDYLIGEWYEGRVVNGKLYDSNNRQKEVIIIGR